MRIIYAKMDDEISNFTVFKSWITFDAKMISSSTSMLKGEITCMEVRMSNESGTES